MSIARPGHEGISYSLGIFEPLEEIPHGVRLMDIWARMLEIRSETGLEVGLVRMRDGRRMIGTGGPDGLHFPTQVIERVIAHTHDLAAGHLPTGSPDDLAGLPTFFQRSGYVFLDAMNRIQANRFFLDPAVSLSSRGALSPRSSRAGRSAGSVARCWFRILTGLSPAVGGSLKNSRDPLTEIQGVVHSDCLRKHPLFERVRRLGTERAGRQARCVAPSVARWCGGHRRACSRQAS